MAGLLRLGSVPWPYATYPGFHRPVLTTLVQAPPESRGISSPANLASNMPTINQRAYRSGSSLSIGAIADHEGNAFPLWSRQRKIGLEKSRADHALIAPHQDRGGKNMPSPIGCNWQPAETRSHRFGHDIA